MKRENSVEVHQLTRNFGDFTAVDHVSFEIPKGEIFGLLGPNGAGKTTLLRTLLGFLRPTRGTASIAGFDIISHSLQARRQAAAGAPFPPSWIPAWLRGRLR